MMRGYYVPSSSFLSSSLANLGRGFGADVGGLSAARVVIIRDPEMQLVTHHCTCSTDAAIGMTLETQKSSFCKL
eukprot:3136252-Amphidinium_carterae.1